MGNDTLYCGLPKTPYQKFHICELDHIKRKLKVKKITKIPDIVITK